MRVPKIDKDKCIGCALCPAIAAATFKMNDAEGKAEVLNEAGDDEATIQMAINSCPTGAISFSD